MAALLSILLLLFLVLPAAKADPLGAPGCGSDNVKFNVSTDKNSHPAPPSDPGNATVYFLQDDAKYDGSIRPTTRFGVDGNWVGATHANSYFYASVAPGEHHLCANWQSVAHGPGASIRRTAAAEFTAEAGKTYYFRASDVTRSQTENNMSVITFASVDLKPVDSDEAQVLLSSFAFSSSKPKK